MDPHRLARSPLGTAKGQLSEDGVKALCDGPDASWTSRSQALIELENAAALKEMAIPGSPTRERFTDQLRLVSLGIALCVGDLRSTLVKEACTVLITLADLLGPRLVEAVGDDVLPALLRRSATRKSVIRLSSIAAATAMLHRGAAGVSARVAIHVAETLLDAKNPPNVRASAAEHLGIMLSSAPMATLEKMGPELDSAILVGCTDAANNVRALSRENLRCLKTIDAQRAGRVLVKLPGRVQKLLEKEPVPLVVPLRPAPRPLYSTTTEIAPPRQPRRSMLPAAKRRESREPAARPAGASTALRPRPALPSTLARAGKPPLAQNPDIGESGDITSTVSPMADRPLRPGRTVPRARAHSMMPSRATPLSSTVVLPSTSARPWATPPPLSRSSLSQATHVQALPQSRKSKAMGRARRSIVPGAAPVLRPWAAKTAKSPARVLETISQDAVGVFPSEPVPSLEQSPNSSANTGTPEVEVLTRSSSADTLSSSPSSRNKPAVSMGTLDSTGDVDILANQIGVERRISVSSCSTQSSKPTVAQLERRATSHSSSSISSREQLSSLSREENSLPRSSTRCSLNEETHSSAISESASQESISTILNRAILSQALENETSNFSTSLSAFKIADVLNSTVEAHVSSKRRGGNSGRGRISFLLGSSMAPLPPAGTQPAGRGRRDALSSGEPPAQTKSHKMPSTSALDAPKNFISVGVTRTESASPISSAGILSAPISKPASGRAGAIRPRSLKGNMPSRSNPKTGRRIPIPPGAVKENRRPVLGAKILNGSRHSTVSGMPRQFGRELSSRSNVENNIPKVSPLRKEKTKSSGISALLSALKLSELNRSGSWQSRVAAAKSLMIACESLESEALSSKIAERTTEALAACVHDVHLRVVTQGLDGVFHLLLNGSSAEEELFAAFERRPGLLRAVLGRTTDKREAARLAAERAMQSFAVLFCAERQATLLVRSHERGTSRLPVTCSAISEALRRAKDLAPSGRVLDGIVDMVSEGTAHRLTSVRKAAAELGTEIRKTAGQDELHEACGRRRVRLAIFS